MRKTKQEPVTGVFLHRQYRYGPDIRTGETVFVL